MSSHALVIVLCFLLGFAPFLPEPHLVKQALNLIHDRPMDYMDYFDIVFHGAPLALGIVLLVRQLRGG